MINFTLISATEIHECGTGTDDCDDYALSINTNGGFCCTWNDVYCESNC